MQTGVVLLALSQQFLQTDDCLQQKSFIWTHRKKLWEAGHSSLLRPHFVIPANETAVFLCTEILLSASLIL